MTQKSKFIRFIELVETTPPGLDGHRYRLAFELGEKRGDQFHPTETHAIDVDASRTLQTVWNKSDEQMAAYTGTSASSYVIGLARENRLHELQPLRLNTYTAPKVPPESPTVEPGTILPVSASASPSSHSGLSFLSDDISELRDQINALSKDLWGGRLLLLSQERPLLDMYKLAQSANDLRVRVQSLGIIAKDLDGALLARVARVTDSAITGEFVLLQKAIETLGPAPVGEEICSVLKQINNLRQGYPAHGDNAKKFLDAHRFFGLPYPVSDYTNAWESVLGRYFGAMRTLRATLSEAWERRS